MIRPHEVPIVLALVRLAMRLIDLFRNSRVMIIIRRRPNSGTLAQPM